VFLVHDYWPGAQTLLDFVTARGTGNLLAEPVLWSIATQLLTALRCAHDQKISFRGGVSLHHVLLTGRNRVRIASAGLMHILEPGRDRTGEEEHMREDVAGLARIMLTLACMSPAALRSPKDSVEFISGRYSKELTTLIAMPFQRPCSVYDVLALCSRGLLVEMDELYSHSDALEEHLSKQLETSRLNRVMVKLNLVNERPEYGKSEAASWAETGDRYILKLFRDYVFHQTDENGQPWLDMGHILTSLNKLDIGSRDKVLLSSRDGRSILVVTFADVRKCLEDAFQELVAGHRSTAYYQDKRANPTRAAQAPAFANKGLAPGQGMAGMLPPQALLGGAMGMGMGMPFPGAAGGGAAQYGNNPYAAQQQRLDGLYTAAHHQQPY
jgi:PAB-dependent poly(A)-specific ribonuclease subunit 3